MSVDAEWQEDDGRLLLYVYADRPAYHPASARQATVPAQVIFDYDANEKLIGVEVIAEMPQ